MTSAQKSKGGGSRNAANLRTNNIDFADREGGGGKKNKIVWTSHMEAPKPKQITSLFPFAFIRLRGKCHKSPLTMETFCPVRISVCLSKFLVTRCTAIQT